MKLFIASDIHGSYLYAKQMVQAFINEKAEKLLLLGDILYHGPRNDLPDGYAPKKVIELLNSISDKIICVRGNCDAEVDQMVLNFPIMAEYVMLNVNHKTIYATHGHHVDDSFLQKLNQGDILLCGHTHVPAFEFVDNYISVNCGSVSIPKANSNNAYLIFENNVFTFKKLNGEVYDTKNL